MENITYPVILTYEDDTIYVGIPDLNIGNYASYGETLEQALQSAKELITLNLFDLEENGIEFPKMSSLEIIKGSLKSNQELALINLFYPYEKSLIKIQYKKKTLTIPVWLDMLATNKNINFSEILKNALLKELEITQN